MMAKAQGDVDVIEAKRKVDHEQYAKVR